MDNRYIGDRYIGASIRSGAPLKLFDSLPKSIKKTIRYIHQDVTSLEKLEEIEKQLLFYLEKRKEQLKIER